MPTTSSAGDPGMGGVRQESCQDVGRRYVRWYNARYHAPDAVGGRYRTCLLTARITFSDVVVTSNSIRQSGALSKSRRLPFVKLRHNAWKSNAILVEHDLDLRSPQRLTLGAQPTGLASGPTAEDEVAAIRMPQPQCRSWGKRFSIWGTRIRGRALPARRGVRPRRLSHRLAIHRRLAAHTKRKGGSRTSRLRSSTATVLKNRGGHRTHPLPL